MPIIDAHQHVWDPARAEYSWLGPGLEPINRTVTFEEVQPSLVRCGVQATVLVQSADNDEDTNLMLDTAARFPQVAAVVAYAPLADPERTALLAARFEQDPLIVGVRNLIHNIPDPDWLLRADVREGLEVLESAGLAFDLVSVLPRHLEIIPELSARHPRLRMAIDHLSKPPIGTTDGGRWRTLMAEAARNPLVHAKISGLYAAAGDPASWSLASIRPYIESAVELFGPGRLMYGGDWPISVTAGGYDRIWSDISTVLSELPQGDRDQILGGTAQRFYRIDDVRLSRAVEASAAADRAEAQSLS
jgi:L-fuconolactonase